MPAETIRRSNFVDEAYGAIRRLILGGELRPGTQLKIDALSRQLGVSNSPIREALRRLENERWVETIPYRGAFVRPVEAKEMIEVYEIREMLEAAALRKVMPNPTTEGLEVMERALHDIRKALRSGKQLEYLEADTRFHAAIVHMAGNARLSAIFGALVEQGTCFMLGRTPEAMGEYRSGEDDHGILFETIRAGETRTALRILHRHLCVSPTAIRKLCQAS
ncbi:MAG: GntR family transcriptional regulator [Phycisphaerae bacterium]|nr:GntR family transcriptional regulator [Phycisphaerae bacterium]